MKKTIVNYIYNSIYQILTIFVPLLTTPYLARVIGADGLGKYAYSYSVAYVFFIFIKLGLNNYGNREIALCRDNRNERNRVFSDIYTLQALTAFMITGIYFLYSIYAEDKLYAFIMAFYVISAGLDISWFYYGLEEFKVTSIRDIIVKIITLVCVFAFIKGPEDAWKYALIRSGGLFISQACLWINIKSKVVFIRPSLDGIEKHLLPNLFLFIPTIAMSVYKYMDKIMLGAMTNDVEVGLYHGCENIIAVPLALVTSLGTVMMPMMVKVYKDSEKEKATDIIDKSIGFAVFITSFIGCGIMAVAKEFVPFFYGDGFEKCVILYYIILPSCIFVAFANVIRTQYLIPNSWDKVFILSLVSGAIFNVIINYLLIPKFESYGAAIGTLFAEIVVCVIQTFAVRNKLPIGRYIIRMIKYVLIGAIIFVLIKDVTIVVVGNAFLDMCIKLSIYSCAFLLSTLTMKIIEKKTYGIKKHSRACL